MTRLLLASISALLFLLLAVLLTVYLSSRARSVETTSGFVKGTTFRGFDGRDYPIFLGIPYAKPPVGPLRFQKPQPSSWSGVRDASSFGHVCPQHRVTEDLLTYGVSEDCLTLNIFTPPDAQRKYVGYPVMFYIHGGSLQSGSASRISVAGVVNNLVSKGIIVVTIQYRVGLLGFFTTLTNEFPPNLGFHDQILALEWVRANIGKFGGDPGKITLAGQSAGACSASAIAMSPRVPACYFRGVIQLSGTAEVCWDGTFGSHKTSEQRARSLCNVALTLPADNATAAALKTCLQTKDYKQFLDLEINNTFGWNIVTDGDLFPNVPRVLLNKAPRRPTLLGVTSDEWSFFEYFRLLPLHKSPANETEDDVVKFMKGILAFTNHADDLIPKILGVYKTPIIEKFGNAPGAWFHIVNDIFSDATFGARVSLEAERLLEGNNKNNVFLYEFADSSKSKLKLNGYEPVGHADDIGVLFSNTTHGEHHFASIIANFVKGLRPVKESVSLDTSTWKYLKIGSTTTRIEHNFMLRARKFWNVDPFTALPSPPTIDDLGIRAKTYADTLDRICLE